MNRARCGLREVIYERRKNLEKVQSPEEPLEIGKEADVSPSTTTKIARLEKKLEIVYRKKGQAISRNLANRALCQTLSNALEISRAMK